MSTNATTVKFYLGEESRLVIENFSIKDESIFKDSYNTALSIVCDYIKNVKQQKSESAADFFRQTADVVDNNIIAFIGERGTGKSSCMLSVANMLKNISMATDKTAVDIKKNCDNGFEILETIDPSFFDEKTNVLEIILGRMFSNFRKKCEKSYENRSSDFEKKKADLFKAFQTVKESFVHTNGSQVNENDCVDGLLKLTASVDLRDSFKYLIEKYLEFLQKDYLIISVDDLDLHTQHAYKMAEQLRKYLRQEKVIVLMALKLEQLEYAVQLQFETQYKEIKEKSTLDILNMVSKYILKLIPDNNRIYLPSIDVYYDAEISVLKKSAKGTIEHNGCQWIIYDDNHKGQTLKYFVVSLIFQKTRYLFYHTEGRICPIVPSNLRELRFLIETLCSMPDYTENEKREQNKQVFKEYYLKTWVPSNLNSKGINLILEIFQLSNPSEINKAVIQKLSTQYKSYFNIKEKDETDDTIDEINRIIEVGNTSYNISLGDVLLLLTYLKERLDSTYDKMLIFAIETFYSMRLYEYYDLMTEKYKYEKRAKLNENVDYSIKKKDVLDGSTAYKMLVGGSFVNTETTKVMSPQKNNIRRDIRPINKSVLDKLFNEVNENGGINCDKLKWVEFFVLFTSRKYYDARRAGVSEEKWRKQNEVTYKTNLDSPRLLFDVFSIFNNITDVKEQYNRYNPELFELASQKGINSLYNKIIEECYYTRNRTSNPPDEKWDKEWSLKSSGCIRNIDVLESLIENVNLLKKAYHKENYQHLRSFLNRISEFSIMTYDKKNEKDRYTIKFEFVNVLSDFFKSQCDDIALSENEGVIHPFERVYSSCVEEKTEEQKENNSFKTLAESLSWKTGSSARKKIFEAYPEYAKDKHFISIVEAQIPNGFTIKRKNSAQKIIEDILNKYQSANYEQPF